MKFPASLLAQIHDSKNAKRTNVPKVMSIVDQLEDEAAGLGGCAPGYCCAHTC